MCMYLINYRKLTLLIYSITNYRIFKQTVRSAGANLTMKHLEEVSMSVLFLMKAAQKTDNAFGVSPPSSTHTTQDAVADITTMMKHLVDKAVIIESAERHHPPFVDPTESGWKKLTNKWLKETLERTSPIDSTGAEVISDDMEVADAEYSLA